MFTNFQKFNESIKLNQAKKYTQIWKDANMENYMSKEFDNKYRIYLPIGISSVNIETDDDVKDEVVNVLYDNGYEIESYNANLCKKIGTDKNFTKITKILQKIGNTELLIAFNKNHEQLTKLADVYFVVISRHPVDIAGMTTGRRWQSCMDIESGVNRHYVEQDVKEGSIIAYLIKNDDKNIQNPLSRILIKPYIYQKTGKTYLMPGRTYGTISEKFEETINDWLVSVQGDLPTGYFEINQNLYDDGQKYTYNIEKYINDLIGDICTNILSIDYDKNLKTIKIECEYFNLYRNIENFTITSLIADDVTIDCNYLKESDFSKNAIQTKHIYFENFDNNIDIISTLMSWSDIMLNYVNISSTTLINNLKFLENCQIDDLIIAAPVRGIENILNTIICNDLKIGQNGLENSDSSFIDFIPINKSISLYISSTYNVFLDLSNFYSTPNDAIINITKCENLQLINTKKIGKVLNRLIVNKSNIMNVDEFIDDFENANGFIDTIKFRNCTLDNSNYNFEELFSID